MTAAIDTRAPCGDRSEDLRIRLASYGFTRQEIADTDRLPEQLILSTLAIEPTTALALKACRWWMDRPRRLDLAFERLRATGKIVFGEGGLWRVVSQEKAERKPAPRVVQRSLF
jgi:hypothetical protein